MTSDNSISEPRETPKFNLFVKYYSDTKEKETFGNATQSVIKAYNLDPATQYATARSMASQNITKLNFLARDYLESRGYSLFKMIDIAVEKMEKSTSPIWWDRVMLLMGYDINKLVTININNGLQYQSNQLTYYSFSQNEKNEFNKTFDEWFEQKYGRKSK